MNTTNTGLKTLFNFLLMLVMIGSPISTAFSQQTITSTCVSPRVMDVHVRGILGQGDRTITFTNSDTNKAIIECTCRDREDDGIEMCPSQVRITINKSDGPPEQIWAQEVFLDITDDDTYPSKLYRATYTGSVSGVTYNAPSSSVSRSFMRGLVVWQQSVGSGTPNTPNNFEIDRFFYRTDPSDAEVRNINVPQSSVTRNFLIQIPVHEHGNRTPPRQITYQVRGYNSANNPVTSPVNIMIDANNYQGEIRLDQIPLNNVPASVKKIRVTILSPDTSLGTSVIVGSIMVTSTTPCCIPTLTCPSNITRSTDTDRCDYTVQGGELNPTLSGGCTVTLTNSYNGNATLAGAKFPVGTTIVTWSASNIVTCQTTITVNDNQAPMLTDCPSDITVTAEAPTCEGSPEWTAPNGSDNCEATVTGSHQSGDSFPVGTTTVTYTATDAAGNTDICEFDVTVVQSDTTVTVTHIDDNDINTGTNDQESFPSNPPYRFFNPGLPTIAILTDITLELYFRVFGMSCENEIEVRVTDPMGNITIFKPFETCDGIGLYHVVLDLPDVLLEEGSLDRWEIEFRDTKDQNVGAAEFSPRFARLIYDATVNECDVEGISTSNKNELLSELSEVRLYPVPTSGVLNMEYTSDENSDLFIEIFDGTGRVVSHQKESAISGVNTFNMNVHSLAQGMYYLRIMDNIGRMQVKPFTKINP